MGIAEALEHLARIGVEEAARYDIELDVDTCLIDVKYDDQVIKSFDDVINCHPFIAARVLQKQFEWLAGNVDKLRELDDAANAKAFFDDGYPESRAAFVTEIAEAFKALATSGDAE